MLRPPRFFLIAAMLATGLALGACSSDEDEREDYAASDTADNGAGNGALAIGGGMHDPGVIAPSCAAMPTASNGTRDITGIELGKSADMAYQVLRCANPAFELAFEDDSGFPLDRLPDGSKPRKLLNASAGLEKYDVFLVGMPGEEKVVAIRRTVEFGEGAEPPVTSLTERITTKYGKPTDVDDFGSTLYMEVPHAPDGPLLGPENSLFNNCTAHRAGPDDSMRINDGCGLSINVQIDLKATNRGLAKGMGVALVDQRQAMQAIALFNKNAARLLSEQQAQERDAAQRAVRDAGADRGRMPSL